MRAERSTQLPVCGFLSTMKLRYASIVELPKRSKTQAVRRVAFHPNAQLAFVLLDDEIVGALLFLSSADFAPISHIVKFKSHFCKILISYILQESILYQAPSHLVCRSPLEM